MLMLRQKCEAKATMTLRACGRQSGGRGIERLERPRHHIVMASRCTLFVACLWIACAHAIAQIANNDTTVFPSPAAVHYKYKSTTKNYFGVTRQRWEPPSGPAKRQEWMQYHGMNKSVFNELKAKVVRCKTMMLRNANIQVDQAIIDKMDEFLLGGLVSIEQVDILIENEMKRQKRKMRNYRANPNAKWRLPIEYKYDGSHDAHDIDMIEQGIRHWEDNTCVLFKRYHAKDKVDSQHVLFTNQIGGCWSYVAQVAKNESFPQQLNLQSSRGGNGGCTDMLGIPVHEIGHVLGCWHEHVRSDRDKYVVFHPRSVPVERHDNFRKLDALQINNHGIPYDMGSVMHYGPKEMAIQTGFGVRVGLTTIKPLYQATIGQRVGLSYYDIQLVNKVYCSGICRGRCKNNGHRNPSRCGRCICPEGFGGRRCQKVAPAKGGCWPSSSAEIVVTSTDKRYVETRDFQIGGSYKHGDYCNWLLKAPVGCNIAVHFEGDFGLYCMDHSKTCLQWIEIKYQKDLTLRGPRFCCGSRPRFTGNGKLTSEGNQMLLIFDGRYPLVSNLYTRRFSTSRQRGFRLVYTIANPACLPAGTKKPPAFFSNPRLPKFPKLRIRPCQPYPYCECTQWNNWSAWSICSRSCSGCGVQMRFRKCVRPRPMIETSKRTCMIKACGRYGKQYGRYVDQFDMDEVVAKCCYNFKSAPPKKMAMSIKCGLVS